MTPESPRASHLARTAAGSATMGAANRATSHPRPINLAVGEPGEPPAPEVRAALGEIPGIPVVTGFVAVDRGGDLTTLGPNGSDLSAVWFGEALSASEVELWKDVPGFLTADPKVVPAAKPLASIGRTEAIELAIHGAELLHPAALEPACRSEQLSQRGATPWTRSSTSSPSADRCALGARRPD